jgi:hypothetical protein
VGWGMQLHLAMQTYDLVDKHIQRLDKSLRKYEEDVEHRACCSLSPLSPANRCFAAYAHLWGRAACLLSITRDDWQHSHPCTVSTVIALDPRCDAQYLLAGHTGIHPLPDAAKEGLKLADLSAIIASQAARARTKGAPSASHKKGGGQQYMMGGPGEVGGLPGLPKLEMDLPIDPNEPTYCFCNRVSFGEMIACDNEQCKVPPSACGAVLPCERGHQQPRTTLS